MQENKFEKPRELELGTWWFKQYMQTKSLCVDVGAFRGKFSYEYCNIFDNVIAFEPNPYMIFPLMQIAKVKSNLRYQTIALGNKTDLVDFHILTYDNELNSRHFYSNNFAGICSCSSDYLDKQLPFLEGREQFRSTIKVLQMPLDHFNLAPNFIKIDAEGSTLSVLEGAIHTIASHKPFIQTDVKRAPILEDIGYCWLTDKDNDDGTDQYWVHRDYYEEKISKDKT